ncbi:MAG: hypothetical protein Q8919_07790 [Bacteroidota bacterium]|nr:hypothetical protein [Bacteroidota bacterium]
MKQRHPITLALITGCIVLFLAAPVFGSWQIVKTTRGAHCGFFFNEFIGLIGSVGSEGIYKTTDGGITWAKANVPPNFVNGYITQIFMTDQMRGWATVEDFNTKQCIWMTTDGGLNWKSVGPTGQYDNIYETPTAVVALSRDLYGKSKAQISTNGGTSFFDGPMQLDNGIDFVDALHGVVTSFTDTARDGWMLTSDGGVTWAKITNPVTHLESWSIYGVKGSAIFYAAPEGDPVAGRTPTIIKRSTDYGASWNTVGQLKSNGTNFYSTGHIAGVGELLYVQSDRDLSVNPAPFAGGMYRSSDRGVTWQFVGGPTNERDTRFVVTGCSGGVVYAFDKAGNVWKSRDGGDGQLQEPPVAPKITGNPIVFAGPICSTSYAALEIENAYCFEDTIVSAVMLDSGSQVMTSGALTVTVVPSFPLLLLPNKKDSIRFQWQPFKLFHSDTTVTIHVKVRYFSKILGQAFDTTVTILVHAVGEPPKADVTPLLLHFDSIDFCQQHDTSFTVRNNGCDTLYITNAIGTAPQHYVVLDSNGNPLLLPVAIPPGDLDKIIIRLNLDSAGSYSSDLLLKLRHQGIEKDTTLNIAAVISPKGSFSLPDSIDLGAVSTCSTIDTLLLVKNFGCNLPMTISSATLKFGTEFSLVGTPPYTSPIAPNSSGTIHVRFAPNVQQPEVDTLTVNFFALGEQQVKKIVLRGSGIVTAPKFTTSLATDTLFNLNLTKCDAPDTFHITLSNPGCLNRQKISIISADLQGASAPDVAILNAPNLPIDIGEGVNAGISVTASPLALGTFNGFLHLQYRIQGDPTVHDTLMAYFLTVVHGPRILTLDHDTIDLGTMKFCDSRDSAINIGNLGCDLLDILSVDIQGIGNFSINIPPGLSPLSQNQYGRLPFHFDPTQAGDISGTITIKSVSDTRPVRVVTIIAHVTPTDTLTFDMLPTRGTFYAGDSLTVRLVPQQGVHNKGLKDVAFTFNFNGDLLSLIPQPNGIRTLIPNATCIPGAVTGTPKHTSVRVLVLGQPELNFDADTPVVELRFYVRLTDSISTTFNLTDIQLNGGDTIYPKCELGILSSSLSYQLALRCGDSTLVRFMQLGSKFKLFAGAAYPDPISGHNNYQGIIPFSTNIAGRIGLRVFDQLGRNVISQEMTADVPGSYSFSLDGRDLAAGCYSYVLEEISNSASGVRGRFIIAK